MQLEVVVVLMNIFLVAQFLLALGLIIVILLQSDKGTGLSGAFGGGASHTKFGLLSGGTPLGKATVVLGTVFIINSIFMTYLARASANKFVAEQKAAVEQQIPIQQLPVTPGVPIDAAPVESGTPGGSE
jgi:preprotein translocase subunit SecG